MRFQGTRLEPHVESDSEYELDFVAVVLERERKGRLDPHVEYELDFGAVVLETERGGEKGRIRNQESGFWDLVSTCLF